MARYYKKKYYKKSDKDESEIDQVIYSVLAIFLIILFFAYQKGIWSFIATFIVEVGIIFLIIYTLKMVKRNKDKAKKNRLHGILNKIDEAGLNNEVNSFISRFGLGQEKDKNSWEYRSYKISYDRIGDFRKVLSQKGVSFDMDEIYSLLQAYINERELNITAGSVTNQTNLFSKLNKDGADFERLLFRLYESMGYLVQIIGKTGDQGGDLIATKGGERILIQAKCYIDWSVGNSAVQQAFSAQTYYNCNKAVVITTSYFTNDAITLSKTNGVELITKDLLQKMLLDNLKESWR